MTNIPFEREVVVEKLNSINFRGPDNLGYLKMGDITLGHVRLAILDLEVRSNQPFVFKNFSIVFNGEIYNYKDIRNELQAMGVNFETTSDTEVLVKGYATWGRDVLPKLNGMFAFAIYNTLTETVFCARDRLGVKPFFYYWNDGKFELCSQLRPLINKNSKVSEEAISIYLDCGYVPSPFSILNKVFKLPPGKFMEINLKKGINNMFDYWDLQPATTRTISYEDAKCELHALIKDAVKIRMQADVPLGTFLSGGIDSALITAIASKISNKPIHTFTIGFEDPKFDESKAAREFSDILGTHHSETIIGAKDALKMLPKLVAVYDEPFADSSALPSLLLNSVTKKFVTVALSGDGGDESFLGYEHFDMLTKFNKIKVLPLFIRNLLGHLRLNRIFGGKPETVKGILGTKDSDEFSWKTFNGFDTLQKNEKTNWRKKYESYKLWSKSSIQRMADLNIKLWLENDSNVKVDRASMAYAVEIRSPFLDYRIIEYARTLPIDYRLKNGVKKRILKDILSEYIPSSVFNLPKKGFSIPLADWIRNDLKNEISNALDNVFLTSVPNLDVEKFEKQLEQHMKNEYDHSFNIWKLYILSCWSKEFKIKFQD
jgi:asparagine synthase (glutamine-hydrolysing)